MITAKGKLALLIAQYGEGERKGVERIVGDRHTRAPSIVGIKVAGGICKVNQIDGDVSRTAICACGILYENETIERYERNH